MKNRILFIAQHGLNKGGIQAVIMSIVKNLSEKYVFDIVVFSSDTRYYEDEFKSYGGEIYRIPHDKYHSSFLTRASVYYRWLGDYIKIKRIIREHGPYKVIHCHNSFESAIALLAARKQEIPVRLVQAHVIRKKSAKKIRCILDLIQKRIMLKEATCLIGCSREACDSIYGKENKSQVVLNPYNENSFDIERFRAEPFSAPNLIQIGNYSDLKNQMLTLNIFNKIVKKYKTAKLRYVGFDVDGYETQLKNEVDNLNHADSVEFYPCDADTPYLLSKSTYLLQPSRTEAFGIVLVEAQAMGVKCFVSDVVPAAANAGGCVYISLEENVDVWAEKIVDDFRKTNGKHVKYDCSSFTSKRICSQIDDFYCGKE